MQHIWLLNIVKCDTRESSKHINKYGNPHSTKTISTMRTKQKPFYANSKTESKVKSQVSRNIELYEQKAVNNYKMKICYIDYLSSGQPLVQSICFIINLGVPLFMS